MRIDARNRAMSCPRHKNAGAVVANTLSFQKHVHAANLEENEKVIAELAPTKINEPKTPFHAAFSEGEDVDGDTSLQDGEASIALQAPGALQRDHSFPLIPKLCSASAMERGVNTVCIMCRGSRHRPFEPGGPWKALVGQQH